MANASSEHKSKAKNRVITWEKRKKHLKICKHLMRNTGKLKRKEL